MKNLLPILQMALVASACTNLTAAPEPWNAPASASLEKNPFAGNAAAASHGKTLYQAVCFVCHGKSGKGDGPAGLALNVLPGDLTSAKVQSQSDGALLWKITNGRAPMPPFAAAYGKEDLWKLVSYMRTLSPGGAPPAGPPTSVAVENPLSTIGDSALSVGTDAKAIPDTIADDRAMAELLPLLSPRTGVMISGYATVDFESIDGSDSTFGAKFAPILLVKQGDNLLFEGELEFELEDSETEANLEYAQILWLANDYLTIGAGKFLNPMNYFSERIHPGWINKLPNAPLPFGHGGALMAGAQLGVQARGGVPVGDMRLSYAVYLSNGPSIVIEEEDDDDGDGHGEEEEEEGHGALRNGSLDFDNFDDRNNNLAVGGRIGFSPIPGLEIGYGIEFAQVTPSDSEFDDIDALTQSIDFSYVRSSDALRGIIDARGQFVWVDIDNPHMEPLDFNNESSGGYVQIAYRPLNVNNEFLRNLEPVCRYDWLDLPSGYPDQSRFTIGLNYWLNASTVIKAAVEFREEDDEHGTENYTGFRVQAAMGF